MDLNHFIRKTYLRLQFLGMLAGLMMAASFAFSADYYNISTVAGNGSGGYSGDGTGATATELSEALGVAADPSGNLYIADNWNYRIRKVDTAGNITTLAGNGTQGFSGDGGDATKAEIERCWGITTDTSGNIYISDTYNHRIRKIDRSGNISTIAGNGTAGYSGDGGPATSAKLYYPCEIATDQSENIYVADSWNYRIRKIAKSGIITTLAGNGNQGYAGDEGPAVSARLSEIFGVAVDTAENVYISDTYNNCIRKVNKTGIITTIAGNGTAGYSGDSSTATVAELNHPGGIAVDSAGCVYVADTNNNRIRKIDRSGIITTIAGNGSKGFAGDGGRATLARLNEVFGIAQNTSENIYIADSYNNRIRKLTGAAFAIISGTVTNGKQFLTGATVEAYENSVCVSTATVDRKGGYTFKLPAGNYSIRASLKHFISSAMDNQVAVSGQLTTVNFILKPVPFVMPRRTTQLKPKP